MLDDKVGLHAEVGALLDGERLALELFDGAGGGQVDGDVGAALDFKTEGFNNAAAVVGGVDGNTRGVGDAQRGFPAVEGFVVLIWGATVRSRG